MLPADVPTPNTASLGRFGDVPVSYYTGRPQVGVPIYTLKVRDYSLPVSLSYDTGVCWSTVCLVGLDKIGLLILVV